MILMPPLSYYVNQGRYADLGLRSGRDFMDEADMTASAATWKCNLTIVAMYLLALIGSHL